MDSAVFFHCDLVFAIIVRSVDILFQVVLFCVDQYLLTFESVFFSLREFWPNSEGTRTFVLYYGWLLFVLLVCKKFRDVIFGKPPTVPLVPSYLMDKYRWQDPLRYQKICSEHSSFDFDALSRHVQIVKDREPAEYRRAKRKSRFFVYDYNSFYFDYDYGVRLRGLHRRKIRKVTRNMREK